MTRNGSGLAVPIVAIGGEARKTDQLGGSIDFQSKAPAAQTQAKANSRRQEPDRRRAAFAREVALAEFKDRRAGWLTLSRLVWGKL
jgi:hypothetical protein